MLPTMTSETGKGLKLLLIVPHPDDEVYGASGTLMEYLAAGESCGLVTLTRGEAGRTLGLCDGPEELARMRAVELAACLEVIGLTTTPGSLHEQHQFPDKYLKDYPFEELVETAREAMERLRPGDGADLSAQRQQRPPRPYDHPPRRESRLGPSARREPPGAVVLRERDAT